MSLCELEADAVAGDVLNRRRASAHPLSAADHRVRAVVTLAHV